MKKLFILLFVLNFCALSKELKLEKIYLGDSSLEVSGFVKLDKKLYVLSDNSDSSWG